MLDYTIDYEEYYNRQMVWCTNWWGKWNTFEWKIWTGGHCTEFTAYWNENSNSRSAVTIQSDYHDIYKCSSKEWKDAKWFPLIVKNECWKKWTKQSFGQYAALFTDLKDVMDEGDDEDLWKPVGGDDIKAIRDEKDIQELYLISHDWKSRLFFRRKLYTWNDVQSQYKIQILRLRWFDAGQNHNFDDPSEWIYDRQIDTRACDTSMWFIWAWPSIWWAYSEYHLPSDVDDCWVDLTYWNTSIDSWKLFISPQWDSDLYWAEQNRQINPYMKIFIVNGIYLPLMAKWGVGSSILDFKIPLETTINMKDFYKE